MGWYLDASREVDVGEGVSEGAGVQGFEIAVHQMLAAHQMLGDRGDTRGYEKKM